MPDRTSTLDRTASVSSQVAAPVGQVKGQPSDPSEECVSGYDSLVASEKSGAPTTPKFSIPIISKLPSFVKNALKFLISMAMFASLFVFGKIDVAKAWEAALGANKGLLALSVVLTLLSVFLLAHRWSILAAGVGFHRPFMKMVQYCYVGMFLNSFLPSTIGGDFGRCYYLSKGTGRYLHALSSVVVDRALGLAVLLGFATLGILFGPGGSGLPMSLKVPIFIATFGVIIILPIMPKLSTRFLGEENWLSRKLNQSTASVYWHNKKLMGTALFLAIVFQVFCVCTHICVGLALGLGDTVPLWYYFVFYPSVAVLGFITPSVNGIGVREWAYTYFLTLSNVDRNTAVTYALIWLGLNTVLTVAGGIVYVFGHMQISAEDREKFKSEEMANKEAA